MGELVDLINKYGFPIVAAGGTGYMIYYVWEWATKDIKPVLSEANTTLIALIDRIRMLDNDLIRLQQKVNTTLHLRGKIIESERVLEAHKVDAEAEKKFLLDGKQAYCPCRILTGNELADKKVICPCYFYMGEVELQGHCHCSLYMVKK